MTQRIKMPGSASQDKPKVIPPVHSMVEMIWAQMPEFAQGVNGLAHMIHNLQQQISQLQLANLEQAYMLRHMGKALNAEIPSIMDIRREIREDRLKFLEAVLEQDELDADSKAHVLKQIEDVKETMAREAEARVVSSKDAPEATPEPSVESEG